VEGWRAGDLGVGEGEWESGRTVVVVVVEFVVERDYFSCLISKGSARGLEKI
jgi:hypothetical protein